MFNYRPPDDPNLQAALDEVKQVMRRHGLAGACMLVSEDEAAFTYGLHAPWSAIRSDPCTPLGWRFHAQSAEDGKELTERRVTGAVHTICQLSDFGSQTQDWMEQIKAMLRDAGIDFDHTPFGGQPLPRILAGR
jgi:protein tyrosine phosphatase (PTP) superfamily phosphohydrolase (DUF442 family)